MLDARLRERDVRSEIAGTHQVERKPSGARQMVA